MNKKEAAALLAIITTCYPQWSATKETFEFYSRAFSDLDFDTASQAVERWAMTNQYAPTISDVRRTCADLLGLSPALSSQAWEEVQQQIREVGSFGRPTFSDDETSGFIRSAVGVIGWRNLCQSTNQDTVRAHFLRMYEERRVKVQRDVLSSPGLQSGMSPLALGENSDLFQLEQ